ncbi:MAG: DUF4388 domain-containing protein [Deltaproteobacteria bacterium]|nr:DUF4388 domain-containing protein [Deltaproteobacteria bacterium]
MSLVGNLEGLPFIDVIQLLNTSRKTGTLSLKKGKRECVIVFSDGYITGAAYPNNQENIGTALAKLGILSPEEAEQTFNSWSQSGEAGKSLAALLLEQNKVDKGQARKGLEKLVEIVTVDVVSWTKGNFTFDSEITALPPDFAYYSEAASEDIYVDSQMALMDALRIFDEMKRDGTLPEESDEDEEEEEASAETSDDLSADILGLDKVDKIKKEIPEMYKPLEEFDPADIHRQLVNDQMAQVPEKDRETFARYLARFSSHVDTTAKVQEGSAVALVLYSADKLLEHALMTLCNKEGIFVFNTAGADEFEAKVAQCVAKEFLTIMLYDRPGDKEGEIPGDKLLSARAHMKEKYPYTPALQLAPPKDDDFTLKSYADNIRTVIPKPSFSEEEVYIDSLIRFLEILRSSLKSLIPQSQG